MSGADVLLVIYFVGAFITAIAVIARGIPKMLYVQQQTGTAAFSGAALLARTLMKSFFWPIVLFLRIAGRGRQGGELPHD